MFLYKKLFTILLSALLLFVAGCNKSSPEEKILEHLEETIELEKTFEEEQEKINELELKDQTLYEEIIKLDIDNFEKIVDLSNQAIENLDQRLEHLQLEKESIESSEKEFLKTKKLIDKLSSDKKDKGEKMFKAMVERFKSYDDVYDNYVSSIDLTKQLYELLKDEEIDEKEVVSLITKVNDSYELVFEANDHFNEKTEQYNKLKQKFYELVTDNSE